jgi:phage repressor protein C with HTH and peptisase S24 domain
MDYRQLLRIMLQDTKQEDLAKELGTTQATISRWLTGQEPRGSALERIRGLARARRLAEDATIEQDLSGGNGRVFETQQTKTHNKTSKNMRTLQDTGDIANLAHHTGIAQSGKQTENNDVAINANTSDGFWSFPDQVKAGWQNIEQTYAIQITGDSMEPTLSSGSHVFIDTSHKYPSPPDLYAVNYGHGLTIKRVELLPEDKIRIISDNDRYSDFEFHKQDIEVYGRVVASFQWRG